MFSEDEAAPALWACLHTSDLEESSSPGGLTCHGDWFDDSASPGLMGCDHHPAHH